MAEDMSGTGARGTGEVGADQHRFAPDPSDAKQFEPVGGAPRAGHAESYAAADSYSREFYDPDYIATGKGSRSGPTRPAASGGSAVPGRSAGAGGKTAPGGADSHPPRKRIFLTLLATLAAVAALVGILYFALPDAATSADPTQPTSPSAGSQPSGDPSGLASSSVPEGMDPTFLGSTFTVPQDPIDPANRLTLKFTGLDPVVDDTEGVIADLGLWSGDGYSYAVLVADVTNEGPTTVLEEKNLPVFVRTADGQGNYRYEAAVDMNSPWSPVGLNQGETRELAFIFPVPDGVTIAEVGVAAVGNWWDMAVWAAAPQVREI